jgi:ATP-dependent Lhr-like helicase
MLSVDARAVLDTLTSRGALFAHEMAAMCDLSRDTVRLALGELVSAGLAASDGFAGLRALIADKDRSPRESQMAGRWTASAFAEAPADRPRDESSAAHSAAMESALETQGRVFLLRYGVVCRRVLTREPHAAPWRTLSRLYRTLEARGEIRGGRFVSGLSGEQFALPEAVERLREIRRTPPDDRITVISAADLLNLVGVITAGERVAAVASTRIAYRNGVPLAALEGDYIRPLADIEPGLAAQLASALAGRPLPPIASGFVGRGA